MKSLTQTRRNSGFTLIELMVSMGITAIIITVLVTITGVATDTWTRSRSELRASRQAKMLIDTMAKDFESLVSRRGENIEWLHAEIDSGALPNVIKGGGGSPNVASLTFFTAATDRYNGQLGGAEDLGGDVSCVAYRLRFQDPIEGSSGSEETSTFVLYRLLVDPNETFDNLLGQEDLDTAFSSLDSTVNDEQNFICENVHQISVTFLVEVTRTDGEFTEVARVVLDSNNTSGEFHLRGTGVETDLEVDGFTLEEVMAGRLTGVELSVSVLSDAGMIRRNSGDGMSKKDYSRQVYHYSRVVNVPGG